MARKFQDFMREVEAEAHREGPKAVAELATFDAHFRLAGELLSLRKARGLTQRQLSAKTGIQQSEISRIEAAHSNPTVGTVSALARALGAEVRLVVARKRTPKSRVVVRRTPTSSARVVRRSR
ncbi:MAG TPA: helix-turn-helix transcriptional regulator [Anaeromyxobacteraceae bacterium]|nr:helix-turn-helix transcriptional regulator [Anaeromyxobacteraceae bacterium]